ncbi:uncharacterized protein [Chironomus tepperi]|uniref:uncharacterized protein n=1 Tax=Chironomus tepperi TaxID=113505 RepID=UPI00391EFB2C
MMIFLIFYQYWKSAKILDIFGTIYEFDEKAKIIKIHINYNSYRHKSLIYIIISFITVGIVGAIVLYFVVDDNRIDNDIFTATFYYLCLFYSNAIILQFSGFVISLRDRMNMLHLKVSSMRNLTNFEVMLIIELYEKLFKSLDLVNRNCTTLLIPITLNLLMNVTFSMYAFGRIVYSDFGVYSTSLILLNISVWLIEHAVLTIFLINSAASTQEAIEHLQVIGYETSRHQKITNYETRKIFKGFLRYIKSSNFRLRTLFFNIDWALLFTLLSTATTFIIITCQFETSLTDSNTNNPKNST